MTTSKPCLSIHQKKFQDCTGKMISFVLKLFWRSHRNTFKDMYHTFLKSAPVSSLIIFAPIAAILATMCFSLWLIPSPSLKTKGTRVDLRNRETKKLYQTSSWQSNHHDKKIAKLTFRRVNSSLGVKSEINRKHTSLATCNLEGVESCTLI